MLNIRISLSLSLPITARPNPARPPGGAARARPTPGGRQTSGPATLRRGGGCTAD